MEEVCFQLPGHGDVALRNMNSLRTQQHFCDITIVASGRQAFRGHKVVLAACSPFLRDQFLLNPSSELQVSVLHSATVVCKLLQSCYTGTLKFHSKDIVNYLTAASYLQMEHIVEKCRGALSMYMRPRNPSPTRTVKTEEPLSMAMTVSGSVPSIEPGSPQRISSPQPHSPEVVCQASGSDHTESLLQADIQHREAHTFTEIKVRASTASLQDDVDGDYEVLRVRIKEDEQEPEEIHDDELGEPVILGDPCPELDPSGAGMVLDGVSRIGGLEKEGLRTWRRRLLEPRTGRGRGFRHRRRGTLRDRRPAGGEYQEAWRFPSAAEILALGGDLGSAYLSAHAQTDSPPRMQYGLDEGQEEVLGEEPGTDDLVMHYGLDDTNGDGGGIGVVGVPADEEGGGADESVAVVGSTSCASGPVACDHCGLAFPSPQSLLVHMRATHLPYVCPCCGKQFTHASNLNRHMSVHRGAKVHRCPLCHKTFTQKATLCDHMNLHSGERPHRCAYCQVRFAHKPALRRHLKEQHGKTTAQNCMEAQRESESAVAVAVVDGGGVAEGI
ncbi:zinc finger and BTB domain-containing protein 12 isoform X2 [Clupea harengus]|uniref:Zinc finger and BTB domain-containing protein 12 isoform X2 n=1 Tax=Clupea harengus TaxID=7950 RepID=A0A6P3W796_CLUHA|nr:zinc finger and BTB domain-containing protein 12 isoform X2 [Clupea harengus]